MMLVAFAATAFAVDVVTYDKAKNGVVTFDHKGHADKMACDKCHVGEPAKIAIDKAAAHGAACKDCHVTAKVGPAKCGECHVKK